MSAFIFADNLSAPYRRVCSTTRSQEAFINDIEN